MRDLGSPTPSWEALGDLACPAPETQAVPGSLIPDPRVGTDPHVRVPSWFLSHPRVLSLTPQGSGRGVVFGNLESSSSMLT